MSETIKKENPLPNLDEKTEIKDSAELKKQKTYQKFKRNQLLNDLLPLSGFIVLFIIYTIVCLANGYTYTDYLWATFDRGVFIALMSIGASFLFTLGQFDMSLGSAMGLSACVGLLVYMSTGNIALSIISCILGAMLVALCNILFSSVLRVPIFIMSIAMMTVLQQVILAFITTFGEKGSSQINLSPNPFYLDEYGIKWVNDTLNSMTLDEKIGQLFHLVAYSNDEKVLDHMVKDLHVNGLMVRGGMSIEEVVFLTNYLQKNSKVPCLISANLESGGNGCVKGGTQVGKQMQIGATDNLDNATLLAHVCGEEANAVGVNWAFAPVSDIDLNWRNPITNTRLYCNDYKKVAKYTTNYIKEIQKLGLLGCGKHFPGDGVDERDQHLVASVNSLSREEWMKMYGHIYKTQIANVVKTIMVGHILQPAWEKYLTNGLKDKDCMPGSLSKGLINGLLRGVLGFKGMISTDATTMAGMTTMMKREIAVPTSIAIGCDCFLFTKNLDEDFAFMKKGYENGILTEKRLNEAVTNILAAKASIGLPKMKANGTIYKDVEAAKKIVGCQEFKDDEKMIADNCVTLIKEEKGVLPISAKKYPRVLLYGLENKAPNVFGFTNDSIIDYFQKKLTDEGLDVTRFDPNSAFVAYSATKGKKEEDKGPKKLQEGALQSVTGMKKTYDLLMYCANVATKSNQTTIRIEWSIPFGTDVPAYVKEIPTIFVSLENPYHLVDVPRVETYINTYGGSEAVVDALIDKLCGRSTFKGKDPVDSFCGKWDTHL